MPHPLTQFIYLYKSNEESLCNAIVSAGGHYSVIEREDFVQVLITLASNGIEANFTYKPEFKK